MLSIFIMYSNDRRSQLDLTLACLRKMDGYADCQRTLVVDGRMSSVVEDCGVVEVPRINGEFNWSHMWQAGVGTAKFDQILYLDSDRLLPSDYLITIHKRLKDNTFLFTTKHFMLISDIGIDECLTIVNNGFEVFNLFQGKMRYEPRRKEPFHGPGKNVMSGNTAFTKRTFFELGGVDPWYRGHGAYADTDFHMTAALAGCRFVDLGNIELHYHHNKLSDSGSLDRHTLDKLSLDNFIYYCHKWSLPAVLAENLALQCHIKKPGSYVRKKIKEYAKE